MTVEEVKELESFAARKNAMTRYDQSSSDKGGLRLSALDTRCLIQKAAFGRPPCTKNSPKDLHENRED